MTDSKIPTGCGIALFAEDTALILSGKSTIPLTNNATKPLNKIKR